MPIVGVVNRQVSLSARPASRITTGAELDGVAPVQQREHSDGFAART
jgi:hypothetical protein